MAGNIGVLVALALLMYLALRGVNIIVASLLCSIVVAVTNGQNLVDSLFTHYTGAVFNFAGTFFLLFLIGAIFGRVMGESQAAASIGHYLAEKLGAERTLIIGVLVCALLTYGGVNVFIVIFTMYPLGLGLMQRANLPKRLFMAATSLGAGTFTMVAMPWSPSIHNNLMATALGTPLGAAPKTGLALSALTLAFGLGYLEYERKKAAARGEGFEPSPSDVIPKEPDPALMPHWALATLPMAIVLGVIMIPQLLLNFVQLTSSPLLAMTQKQPLVWTSFALVLAILVGFVLFRRHLMDPLAVAGRGAENAVLPLINTAVVIGFGGVVSQTQIFANFADLMLNTNMPPLLSAVISINIMAGIAGSASGGLGIFTATMAQSYLDAGVDPELLHRFVAVGSSGLDSTPHSGAVITMLTIMGLTHKQAYKDIVGVSIFAPLAALGIVLGAVLIFG